MRISKFLLIAGAAVIGLSLGSAIFNFQQSRWLTNESSQMLAKSLTEAENYNNLSEVVRNLQLDVIQVQA